jgi:hypothetical protein
MYADDYPILCQYDLSIIGKETKIWEQQITQEIMLDAGAYSSSSSLLANLQW